jgi:predicted nucleic acid-binding protein
MEDKIAVIDASLVVKAIVPNPDLDRCQDILLRLEEKQLIVPSLWVYEVTSALSKAVHFKSLTPTEGHAALRKAFSLGVQVVFPDETQVHSAFTRTLELRRAAAYDSFYIVVAEALNAEFWTADRRLINSFSDNKPSWLHSIDEVE